MSGQNGPSIHDIAPGEEGGPIARSGFALQDHVAAGYCLIMLGDGDLEQVWCESHDDIVLIFGKKPRERVDYVQVKSDGLEQMWSVALLCERKTRGGKQAIGSSILEKSLSHDCCKEPCSFRIVTACGVNAQLKVLLHPVGCNERKNATEELKVLTDEIKKYVAGFKSKNGNDYGYWVTVAQWEIRHSEEAVQNSNLRTLHKLVESLNSFLFTDQIEQVYEHLIFKLWQAGKLRWKQGADRKKIKKADLQTWLATEVHKLEFPIDPGTGKTLTDKMKKAGLPQDAIETGRNQRRYYRQEQLTPKFCKSDNQKRIEVAAQARLGTLRAQLDCETLNLDGPAFHAKCLEELGELVKGLGLTSPTDVAFAHGYMYTLVERCYHRFLRWPA